MKTSQICLLLCLVVAGFAQSYNSQLIESMCAQPQNEQLCGELVTAILKEYRRLADEPQSSEVQATGSDLQMEKRKPSFVRFGKRSSGMEGQMEKRKPSFVRFGRK